jgi:hypothetical protein
MKFKIIKLHFSTNNYKKELRFPYYTKYHVTYNSGISSFLVPVYEVSFGCFTFVWQRFSKEITYEVTSSKDPLRTRIIELENSISSYLLSKNTQTLIDAIKLLDSNTFFWYRTTSIPNPFIYSL